MSRLSALFLAMVMLCSSCDRESDCPPQACTLEFVSVPLRFTDHSGDPVPVRNVSVVNSRTGQHYSAGEAPRPYPPSTYVIVSDLDKETLSGQGDPVDVTASSELTGQVKTVRLVIAGGNCACHISKISGPETVTFDPAEAAGSVGDE